ncbi:MAG: 4-hydroxythreonine-4-phosphate dehydrogenase, partial [Parvularculaceae bacterium]
MPAAPLALTMGEPGGVGAEIAIKAWTALRTSGPCFFLIDDPARLEGLGANVARIGTPREAGAAFETALPVLDIGAKVSARSIRANSRSSKPTHCRS